MIVLHFLMISKLSLKAHQGPIATFGKLKIYLFVCLFVLLDTRLSSLHRENPRSVTNSLIQAVYKWHKEIISNSTIRLGSP